MTNASGQVTVGSSFDAFGALRTGSATNDFLFAGEQFDAEAGLYYLRARYYDPGTGRFITQDPFAGTFVSPARQHPYVYGSNNPLRYVDPTGYWYWDFQITAVFVSVGVQFNNEKMYWQLGIGLGGRISGMYSLAEIDPDVINIEGTAVGGLGGSVVAPMSKKGKPYNSDLVIEVGAGVGSSIQINYVFAQEGFNPFSGGDKPGNKDRGPDELRSGYSSSDWQSRLCRSGS